MYNFVFWFFYRFHQWKDKYDSVSLPAGAVMVTAIVHIGLVYSILRYLSHENIFEWGSTLNYGQRKYIMLPFAILLLLLIYLFYRKRSSLILAKYAEKKLFTVKNIFLIFFIVAVPLIVAIQFVNASK